MIGGEGFQKQTSQIPQGSNSLCSATILFTSPVTWKIHEFVSKQNLGEEMEQFSKDASKMEALLYLGDKMYNLQANRIYLKCNCMI